MLDLSVRLSSIGAFSYAWNVCTDNKESFFVKLRHATNVFLRATFCKYVVFECDVVGDQSVLKIDSHKKSIFFKEYVRKIENLKIKQTNILMKNISHSGTESAYHDLEQLVLHCDVSKCDISLIKSEHLHSLYLFALNSENSELALHLLLTGNCDNLVCILDDNDETPLSFFVRHGMLSGVEYLLRNNFVDVNKYHETLVVAVKNNKIECLKLLLKEGASRKVTGNEATALLCYAIMKDNVEYLTQLLNDDWVMRNCNDFSMVLSYSSIKGDVKQLMFLLDRGIGANINALSSYGSTPLYCAAMHGNIDCLKLLLKAGADVNISNKAGRTPLHVAAHHGHKECVNVLINENNIQINAQSDKGDTALHDACAMNQEECVEILLSQPNIEVNLTNSIGMTALSLSSIKGNFLCVKALLEKRDIQLKDGNGNTPLHYDYATKNIPNYKRYFKQLLKIGKLCSFVNEKNNDGNAPLHLAVIRWEDEFVKELLDVNGIDANSVNDDGDAPLHLAVCEGGIVLCKALMALETIDVDKKARNGLTPLKLAEKIHFSWYPKYLSTWKELKAAKKNDV